MPDIGATSESNLVDAWNGTGPYPSDGKQRRNYRVIAVIRTSTYMLAAASKKSGITNLKQIKDRTEPTWIVGNNQIIFDYYGINAADLRANRESSANKSNAATIHPINSRFELRVSENSRFGATGLPLALRREHLRLHGNDPESHNMRGPMKVLIAGAGPGGLTAALCLAQAGIECEVFESVSRFRQLGVGLNLLPHGVRVLTILGMGDRLASAGIATAELGYFNKFGSEIWREPRGIAAG